MTRHLITTAVVAVALLGAPAFAKSKPHKPRDPSGAITYNVDSKDPNVGWHWEGGMRTCHQDCDNPEIPGSGATCRSLPGGWRECVTPGD
jgi:hypothetical protein